MQQGAISHAAPVVLPKCRTWSSPVRFLVFPSGFIVVKAVLGALRLAFGASRSGLGFCLSSRFAFLRCGLLLFPRGFEIAS